MKFFLLVALVVVVAIVFLTQFDKIAGRGPKQISDGLKKHEKEK